MRYISIFSGVEAASVAWEPLGWEPVAFAEVDAFPSAVLAERYPDVPNLGDVTSIDWSPYRGAIDIIVGGSPCQSFSIAGKREGLKGESGLMFEYIRCVREVRPRWFVWENVPGALSCEKGEAFRQLLSEMDELGYGLAWRVLDAQFFGVAQRRRRVFLVGSLGDRRSAEVLFEPESLRRDTESSREKRKSLAAGTGNGAQEDRGAGVSTLTYNPRQITSPTNGNVPRWNDSCHCLAATDGAPEVVIRSQPAYTRQPPDQAVRQYKDPQIVCMADGNANAAVDFDMAGSLKVGGEPPMAAYRHEVRRLTPRECERLQGFPDDWTRIPWRGKPAKDCPDGPRYKAMGNSMAVPVMRWIGERIAMVDRGEE